MLDNEKLVSKKYSIPTNRVNNFIKLVKEANETEELL